MSANLVSILTPCFNSEKHITRLLDSIVCQSYQNIEMFIIDDGSKDNSSEIIKSFIPKFGSKGYSLTYIYQENSGQSNAINRGLKLVKGEYLIWPDSDDFYATNTAIEQMANILESSDDSVSMVRCQVNLLNEDTLELVGRHQTNKYTKNKVDLFDDCLFVKNNFWFGAGIYMAKVTKLLECISNREIYTEKNAGQNWQLMLPLLYKNKCLTIDKFLYNVLVRQDSHSRGKYSTFEQVCKKHLSYENTLHHTLLKMKNIPDYEKSEYITKLNSHYKTIMLSTCLNFKQMDLANSIYHELKQKYSHQNIPNILCLKYYCNLVPFGNLFFRVIAKIFNLMKRR
ncbi:MAG TPA: glycosyltransferase [Paludibacter sp.]